MRHSVADVIGKRQDLEQIKARVQYLDTVRPMHKQFIEPTKRRADVIFPHGANKPAVDIITTKVVSLIRDLNRA